MRIEVDQLKPGERLIHDAVMDGVLGMPWWGMWVEHPPSEEWAEHLNRIGTDVCGGCGWAPCTPTHGVRLVGGERYEQRVGTWTWYRSRGGVWEAIPYVERLEWLRGWVERPRRPDPQRTLRPLWMDGKR